MLTAFCRDTAGLYCTWRPWKRDHAIPCDVAMGCVTSEAHISNKSDIFQNTGFIESVNSSCDDHIFQLSNVPEANWADWTQLKVRPSNVAIDPILWRIQRRASRCRRQSASLKPDQICGGVFVLATCQRCLKQTNSAEQNKKTFLLSSLYTLTSFLIRVSEDVPR